MSEGLEGRRLKKLPVFLQRRCKNQMRNTPRANAIDPKTTPRMIPSLRSHGSRICGLWLDEVDVVLGAMLDAVEVNIGLAFSVVEAMADEGLIEAEVESVDPAETV